MVKKTRQGTAITALCVNLQTEEFERVPLFEPRKITSERKIEKMCKENAETLGLQFIKADVEYVNVVYTMEDEEFYKNAHKEII